MRKPIIAIDMDDTIVFLMKAIMKHHNDNHTEHILAYENMAAFKHDVFHPDYDIMAYLKSNDTYRHLELMDEYVVPEIKKLHEKYDVVIVTSAFAEGVLGKWEWLQENLPFIPHKNFITCSRKDLLNADVLIDDAIHNVKDWIASNRPAVVPSHHWNQELKGMTLVTMVDGWKNVYEIVEQVLFMAFGIPLEKPLPYISDAPPIKVEEDAE
jgi:5'(3')-deoxyribonucleotidase